MAMKPAHLARVCVVILCAALALTACKKPGGGRTWKVWESWGSSKPKSISDTTPLPPPPAQSPEDWLGGTGLELPPLAAANQPYEVLAKSGISQTARPPDAPGQPVSALQAVYFAYDSDQLDDSARQALDANALWLAANPNAVVQIEGHCDERGTSDYNIALGERRAASVREYLASKGANPANLLPISYGEERPVALGQGEDAWRQNRRAQFLVYE